MTPWLVPLPGRSPLSVVRPWFVLPVPWPCRNLALSPTAVSTGDTVLSDVVLEHPRVPKVVLKKGKTQIFRDGHPMVYSGAVDCVVGRPPPKSGDAVVVTDGAKQPIAWGVYNSVSMFRVRIMQLADEVSRDPSCFLDLPKLVQARVTAAVQLRNLLGFPGANTTVYRLVNSEGDRLSGLVVDMLGDTAVVSSSAAWVEMQRPTIEMVIRAAAHARGVIWRPAANLLKEDGLDVVEADNGQSLQEQEDVETTVEVLENGLRFKAAPAGQKTGFYADQRDSRLLFRSLCKRKMVLDLCCYSGGFAVNAALGGATHVTGVDSSPAALALAHENVELNEVDPSCICFIKADVAEYLKIAVKEGRSWDVVVLDPPKLAPSKKVLEKARGRYRSLNALAMRVTKPGGLLMTCSCSGAMTQSGTFLSTLQDAASSAGRRIRMLRVAGASADHTQDPCYPEGAYLTNVLLCVS